MKKNTYLNLSRRERQILDILYKYGELSVYDILNKLPDPPGYNSLRVILKILVDKGHLKIRKDGIKYFYSTVIPKERVKESLLRHTLNTFFKGSASSLVLKLMDISSGKLTDDELNRLKEIIEKANQQNNE